MPTTKGLGQRGDASLKYKRLGPSPSTEGGHNITRPPSMPRRQNGFRFNGRYLLLTFSQVPGQFDCEGIITKLLELRSSCRIRLARESHANGGVHYHAFVDFGDPFETCDAGRFDVHGHHPNIQPIRRTPQNALDYVSKDGDVIRDDFGEGFQFKSGRRYATLSLPLTRSGPSVLSTNN